MLNTIITVLLYVGYNVPFCQALERTAYSRGSTTTRNKWWVEATLTIFATQPPYFPTPPSYTLNTFVDRFCTEYNTNCTIIETLKVPEKLEDCIEAAIEYYNTYNVTIREAACLYNIENHTTLLY